MVLFFFLELMEKGGGWRHASNVNLHVYAGHSTCSAHRSKWCKKKEVHASSPAACVSISLIGSCLVVVVKSLLLSLSLSLSLSVMSKMLFLKVVLLLLLARLLVMSHEIAFRLCIRVCSSFAAATMFRSTVGLQLWFWVRRLLGVLFRHPVSGLYCCCRSLFLFVLCLFFFSTSVPAEQSARHRHSRRPAGCRSCHRQSSCRR